MQLSQDTLAGYLSLDFSFAWQPSQAAFYSGLNFGFGSCVPDLEAAFCYDSCFYRWTSASGALEQGYQKAFCVLAQDCRSADILTLSSDHNWESF